MRTKLFKHRRLGGGAAPYVSPYLLEILSTRPGAPSFPVATGSLTANTGQTVSCSRAASAYCLGNDGLLHLLGANQIRVEPQGGLLRELQSTNNLSASATPADGVTWTWQAGNAGSATQNVTGPDGITNGAWTVTMPVGGSGCRFYQILGYGTETQSIYAARGTARYVQFYVGGQVIAWWDWDTHTWTNKSGDNADTVYLGDFFGTIAGNDWYRISVSIDNGSTAFTSFACRNDVSNTEFSAGDGTTMLCWAPQVETLKFPTSPIITTSAPATRDADILTIAAADNPLTPTTPAHWSLGMNATPLGQWFDVTSQAVSSWMFSTDTAGGPNTFGFYINPFTIPPNIAYWTFVVPGGAGAQMQSPYITGTSTDPVTFLFDNPDNFTLTGSPDGIPATAVSLSNFIGDIAFGGYAAFPTFGFSGHMKDIFANNTP